MRKIILVLLLYLFACPVLAEQTLPDVKLIKRDNKVDVMIKSFDDVMHEAQKYIDIMKHLKEQEELLKM